MKYKGYIILITKPNDNTLYGPVESAFSLGIKPYETKLFWDPYSLDGLVNTHTDGMEKAQSEIEGWKVNHPEYSYAIYNINDPLLPIIINWDRFEDGIQPSKKTFSGVKNKYNARNLSFRRKTGHEIMMENI